MLNKRVILLVDDDDRNIIATGALLKAYGASVIVARDGAECLEQLITNAAIEIVLLDIMMPVMDGYETLKQIRCDDRIKNLPIIALTAQAMIGDNLKCLEAGANDYCAKPINVESFLKQIKNLLKP
jgi:CheY-like chemotaxis protein